MPKESMVGSLIVEGPTGELPANTRLYNAVGTSGDKVIFEGNKYDTSMVSTWETISGSSITQIGSKCVNSCCNSTNPYDLVGAHVVMDPGKQNIDHGDIFYLIPLCRGCNSSGAAKKIVLRCNVAVPILQWE